MSLGQSMGPGFQLRPTGCYESLISGGLDCQMDRVLVCKCPSDALAILLSLMHTQSLTDVP